MTNRLTDHALLQSRSYQLRRLPALRPLGWLARGWRDLWACPVPGLLHGLFLAGVGMVLFMVARHRFWLLAGAFSGFLLVGPFLAAGMYGISRSLGRGEPAGIRTALKAWLRLDRRLVAFGLLLALAGTGWMMCSAALITAFAPAAVDTPLDFLRVVVLAPDTMLFEAWLGLGALLAAPVFASSVIAMPMLLDRPVGVLGAVFTSWRVVMAHPVPLALWAALIMVLTLLGMATLMLGLVIVLPWLAHASWHAYGDVVRHVDAREAA